MLLLLNSVFDEWAQRFDELRALTDCPSIYFATGELSAHDVFTSWLALPGITEHSQAFLNHCGKVKSLQRKTVRKREHTRISVYKSSHHIVPVIP